MRKEIVFLGMVGIIFILLGVFPWHGKTDDQKSMTPAIVVAEKITEEAPSPAAAAAENTDEPQSLEDQEKAAIALLIRVKKQQLEQEYRTKKMIDSSYALEALALCEKLESNPENREHTLAMLKATILKIYANSQQ